MHPQQLSRELRTGDSPDLQRRRWIIGLSVLGAAMGQIVTLYQTGVINHLPDPPLPIFDSDKVDASNYAYKRANTPDGALMLVTYGITTVLASAGGEHRAKENPALTLVMGAKLAIDVVTNLTLAREEWQENKALCTYCQTASLASIASLGLAMPEVLRAVGRLRSKY